MAEPSGYYRVFRNSEGEYVVRKITVENVAGFTPQVKPFVNELYAHKPIRWVTGWYKGSHGRWARQFIDAVGSQGWRIGPYWEKTATPKVAGSSANELSQKS